jgi:glutathione S-transferase
VKLFYSPGACSVGIHVILEEIGKPYELAPVALKDGAQHKPEFLAINPKSKVPALDRGDGKVLTEWPVIAFWLAKSNPEAGLIPTDFEGEVRCLEMMDYVCGTVHPHGFTRQFRPANFAFREEDHPKSVETGKANARKFFDTIERGWKGGTWVLPSGFSVADAALFFVEYWATRRSGMTLPPRLDAHLKAMLARPAVQRTLAQEAWRSDRCHALDLDLHLGNAGAPDRRGVRRALRTALHLAARGRPQEARLPRREPEGRGAGAATAGRHRRHRAAGDHPVVRGSRTRVRPAAARSVQAHQGH